jgi:hypothetical protein
MQEIKEMQPVRRTDGLLFAQAILHPVLELFKYGNVTSFEWD